MDKTWQRDRAVGNARSWDFHSNRQETTWSIQLQLNLWFVFAIPRPDLFSALTNLCLSFQMAAEAVFRGGPASTPWKSPSSTYKRSKTNKLLHFTVRASHSIDDKNRAAYKQLGLFLFFFSSSFLFLALNCELGFRVNPKTLLILP